MILFSSNPRDVYCYPHFTYETIETEKILPKSHITQLVQWQNKGILASEVILLTILYGLPYGSKRSGFGYCLMTGPCS